MKLLFRFLTIFSILFLSTSLDVQATHIIGGNITYTCTGGDQYAVHVTLYRDCNPGNAGFNDNAELNIYNAATNSFVTSYSEVHDGESEIDLTSDDPCVELPTDLCIAKVTHSFYITIPNSLDGYILNYQVCCFASTVQNIVSPTSFGLNISATIPGVGGGNPSCFSNPQFNQDPLLTLCLYDELDEDFGASLPVPDPTLTLIHSLTTPAQSGGTTPPFTPITWVTGYDALNPVEGNPGIQLNPNTGELTGTITELGFFMFGVKVHVVNSNGDTIAETERPFRYLVSDCNINRSIAELAAPTVCGSLVVDFANGSFGADSYEWNFDDPDSPDNTSSDESPSHTFSDYGSYTVQLVTSAGNDVACSDTSFIEILLEDGVESELSVNNDYQCLSANNFSFQATPARPDVSFEWNFGSNANPPTSVAKNPSGVVFNEVGVYNVELTTFYNECSTQETIQIEVFDGLLSEFTGPTEGCIPFDATFTPTVDNPTYTYTWTIEGQSYVSSTADHTFRTPGKYDVSLYVYDENGCESTYLLEDYIEVFEVPETGFELSEIHISEGEHITITNSVEEDYEIVFTIPELDKEIVSNNHFVYTFHDEGVFDITQTVTNGPCVTVLTKQVFVGPPRVNPPNVFSPNNDQTNDFFYIDPYYNTNIEVHIYDRWGKQMFASDNYELCNPSSGEFCWDGTDQGGNNCISGVYMYTVKLPNGFEAKGVVSLFR